MSSIPMIEQTAGKGAARAAARRGPAPGARTGSSSVRRPGFLTYGSSAPSCSLSVFPLYYVLPRRQP